MISHEHQCIFIHIPKCAGTSIESALGHLDGHTGKVGQDHRSLRKIERLAIDTRKPLSKANISTAFRRMRHRRRPAANPRNKIMVTKEQYDRYFKFTFVRNPWARAYSWYKNVLRDDFHRSSYKINDEISLNAFLRRFAGQGLLRPQTYWIKDSNGSIPLDYIGRFERLAEDFEEVGKALVLPRIQLPHKLKGSQEDYREQYDADSIDVISTVYAEEIELFGYSFES